MNCCVVCGKLECYDIDCTMASIVAFNIDEQNRSNDNDNERTSITPSLSIAVTEFENLHEHFIHYHQEPMSTSTTLLSSFYSDDDEDDLLSTASSSLLAANDNNMTREEFDNLPKQTRDLLKTIQMIIDDDDISFDSDAADEILKLVSSQHDAIHYCNPRQHCHDYNRNNNDNHDDKNNNYPYSYLPPTNDDINGNKSSNTN